MAADPEPSEEIRPDQTPAATPDVAVTPTVSQQSDATGDAAKAVLAEDPRITEAVARLCPALREALQHQLAGSETTRFRTIPRKDFSRREYLLDCIDGLNEKVEELLKNVEDKNSYLPAMGGKNLMDYLAANGGLLNDGGMIGRILIALRVIAKTRLREMAKAPSSEPFDEEEFQRERAINSIISCILGGVNHS